MEDLKRTYLHRCKEAQLEPQETVLVRLQQCRGSQCCCLDLSGQNLSAETCSVLALTLQDHTMFSEIKLNDCMLSEEGAKAFLTGLFDNLTIKVLDLKGNNLKSTGGEMLGQLLSHNKTLQRLVLEWNALGVWPESFSLFCDGLASNTGLKHLDLRNNQINHAGVAELARALRRNCCLEVLDLRWNNIGLLGGRVLLEAVQKNTTILQLELAGNNIPSDTLKAIEQTTGRNSDRHATMRQSQNKTRVLTAEIQNLKQDKDRQLQSLMETIDRQREEMGSSSRSTSFQIGQLHEALNERKSAVKSLTAKVQMLEAALALCEQKNHNLGEMVSQSNSVRDEERERWNREKKTLKESSFARDEKLHREIQNLTETNNQLRNKVEEMERRCKSSQQQVFELKQELTNSTAELKLRLAQAEDRLDLEKHRSKQALEEMRTLRQKEVEHVTKHLEESERVFQERLLKLEAQRVQLEEELSRVKAACVTERAQAEEDLARLRTQMRLEEQENMSSMEEKLRSARASLQEVQLHSSQQKHTISELKAKNSQLTMETSGLQRRIEELQKEVLGKDQERVAEVSKVKVELQEQMGHLQAERTSQAGLREKISALEREMKVLSGNHREALLDKESELASYKEKLRLKEAEMERMREDEAHRATCLQNAILAYVQGSPLSNYGSPKK
ncbi:leucine-rich repeat-containing protein 45 [Synchiropus splendidus]|uniref:leucine-rich repeat-containing protein 45 n=1 Tax=Synchiropus splendidus TaxID=270530 RepID=UPI00237E68FD|nr:leucine-rich repeat-containing protein 45 [Synchiropus splendidus]